MKRTALSLFTSGGLGDLAVRQAGFDILGSNEKLEDRLLDAMKYWWVDNTAPERNGKRELMRGYTSAYKRMAYDKPASALTRNLSYACSDNKLHPEQNRVLSLFEAFRIHTLDRYDYAWQRADGRKVSDKTIREVIGESIPPAGLQVIIDHLVGILEGEKSPLDTLSSIFRQATTNSRLLAAA